ncbi:MAG: glycosyltransferase [Desulfomonile tiedjei]|nr:glycosyltransferase [Desulfomonile tiedjei]
MSVKLVHVATIPLTISLFLRGQIPFMQNRGFEISVVCSPAPESDEIAAREGVRVYEVPMVRGIAPLADLLSLVRLWLLFRRIKPDVVHSSTPKAGPLAMVAGFFAGVPVRIYTLRGVMVDRRTGLARQVLRMMEWIGCRFADQVVAVSRSVAEVIVRGGMCSERKIVVLGRGSSNGVDAEHLFNPALVDSNEVSGLRTACRIPADATVIGFIGRIVHGKGIVELGAAWRNIRDRRDNTFLLIIGPEEPQDPVPEEVLAQLKADPRVVMVDLVPREKMPLYYRLMDVIAFPTYSEGLPNVPLEAAAMKVPVVATRVTGCVDVVADSVTGTLVPVANADALAAALDAYLDDPDLRLRHGSAGRNLVLREFRPETVWQSLYERYMYLLRRKGGPLPEPVAVVDRGKDVPASSTATERT